jgi:ABC-type nitrate/sulfonate/bicarbonate transport system permease component
MSTPSHEPQAGPSWGSRLLQLRKPIPRWLGLAMGLLFLLLVFGLWSYLTAGDYEERIVGVSTLPSPSETFDSFGELWSERALLSNLYVTIRRVVLGFLLAAIVGIPLGVLCGCFPLLQAFFMPLMVFGRNIPLAALIPLTFAAFGIAEKQKVMFIFIACVMFITWDASVAVREVHQRYVDTAYTLGARTRNVITKVLVPLAMPAVFNSLRLLFGLAFGYIMLAEVVKFGSEAGGLGDIIRQSQRRGMTAHIWLILFIIPIVAIVIDRFLLWMQHSLFPYRYGGNGFLRQAIQTLIDLWDDMKTAFWRKRREAKKRDTNASEAERLGRRGSAETAEDDTPEGEAR